MRARRRRWAPAARVAGGRHRTRRASAPPRARRAAGRPASATATAAASCTRRAPSAPPPDLSDRRTDGDARRAPATAPAPAGRPSTQSVRRVRLQRHTCNAACGADADCAPGNVCTRGRAAISASASSAPPGRVRQRQLRRRRLLRVRQLRQLPVVQRRRHGGACAARSPRATWSRTAAARPIRPAGFNGTCDGNGACATPRPPPAAARPLAADRPSRPLGNCNGAGTCVQPPTSCAPYACGGGACRTTASATATARPASPACRASCTNLKPNGAACTAGTECISGNCTDGVCCAAASCGSCDSCAVADKQGTCQPVPAAADPTGDLHDHGRVDLRHHRQLRRRAATARPIRRARRAGPRPARRRC